MDSRRTQTAERPFNRSFADFGNDDEFTQKRLDALLAVNLRTAREQTLFKSAAEKDAAERLSNPLSTEKTYALFGLLLGVFPPLAMFLKFFSEKGVLRLEDVWIVGVVAVINLISATVGYFSGKAVGKIVAGLERASWSRMLLALPFVGILWGILAGAAGGVIVFVIGAVFGAALGALVGAAALPAFTIFHRLLKKGDSFDRRHFLPVGFGVVFVISAFILGL